MRFTKFFLLAAFLLGSDLESKPAQIFLIRHAEKPLEGEELSLKGRERAHALVPYFQGTPEYNRFGPLAAIYATRITVKDQSWRTQQTVGPLAEALGVQVLHPYTETQFKELSHEILTTPAYDGKAVLICWEHHHIPALVESLGVISSVPKWSGSVFDEVWIINYSQEGTVDLSRIEQELMFGDTPKD